MKLIFVNDKNYTRKNSCLASYDISNYGKSEKLYLLKFYLAPPKYELAPRMPPPNCKAWRRHCLEFVPNISLPFIVVPSDHSYIEYPCSSIVVYLIILSHQLKSIQRRVMRIIFPHLKYVDALNYAGIFTLFENELNY